MSNVYPEVYPNSAGIYMTNAFDMPNDINSEEIENIINHNNNDHGSYDKNENNNDHGSYDKNENNNDSNNHISGMFLAIGRLNHSCVPNAQQTFIPFNNNNHKNKNNDYNTATNPTTTTTSSWWEKKDNCIGYEVLYATRDILIGEYILLYYIYLC